MTARLILPDADGCPGCDGSGRITDPVTHVASHDRLCRGTGRRGHKTFLERVGDL